MPDQQRRRDRVESHLTRRRALAGGAALLTAGGSLVFVGEPANAAVSVDSYSVSDAEFTKEQLDPILDVSIDYSYDAGNAVVGSLLFELVVGETVVATEELVTDATTLESTTELSGRIVDSDAWGLTDFSPEVASSVQRTVSTTIRFAVLDSNGDVIVEDSKSDDVLIAVSHPQQSEYIASVGGTGSVRTATDG